MVTVSRRNLLPLLAPIRVPSAFFMLAPNPIQTGETPSFLLATAAPTKRLSPLVTWQDDLERRLTTYFTMLLHTRRDWNESAARSAWGGNPAAKLDGLPQRIMPNNEFGIVYLGSETEPPTEGVRTGNCSECPNIGGRV